MQAMANAARARRGVKRGFNGNRKQSTVTIHALYTRLPGQKAMSLDMKRESSWAAAVAAPQYRRSTAAIPPP